MPVPSVSCWYGAYCGDNVPHNTTGLSRRLLELTDNTRSQLAIDLNLYGQLVSYSSREDLVLAIADAEDEEPSRNRVERLRAWVHRFGLMSPVPAEGYVPPDVPLRDLIEADVEVTVASDAPPPATGEPAATIEHRDEHHMEVNIKGQSLVMSVADLVRVSQLDLTVWRIVSAQVKTWTTAMKTRKATGERRPDGTPIYIDEPSVVRNWGVTAQCQRRMEQPTPPTFTVSPPAPAPVLQRSDDIEFAVVIPDLHIGFRRLNHGRLYPLHDRRAIDIVRQVCQILQPEYIRVIGDWGDLAELSESYPCPAEMIDTAQPVFAEMHWTIGQLRAAAPNADFEVFQGNHEERFLKKRDKHLGGVAKAKIPGEPEELFSMAKLIGVDQFDIRYIEPYGSHTWLWDRVDVHHGDIAKGGSGRTVASVIADANYSQIFGHIHKAEVAHRTLWGPNGWRQIFVASPGFLGRIDPMALPAAKPRNNWQQAFAVVAFDRRTQQETVQIYTIHQGACLFRGARIVGVDRTREVSEATGWRNMAEDWLTVRMG